MTKQERLERKVKSLERKVNELEARGATHLHFHDDGCDHRRCHWCDCNRLPPQFVPTPWTYPITTGGITTWTTSNVNTASNVLTVTV